jgi:hypothetical protein
VKNCKVSLQNISIANTYKVFEGITCSFKRINKTTIIVLYDNDDNNDDDNDNCVIYFSLFMGKKMSMIIKPVLNV